MDTGHRSISCWSEPRRAPAPFRDQVGKAQGRAFLTPRQPRRPPAIGLKPPQGYAGNPGVARRGPPLAAGASGGGAHAPATAAGRRADDRRPRPATGRHGCLKAPCRRYRSHSVPHELDLRLRDYQYVVVGFACRDCPRACALRAAGVDVYRTWQTATVNGARGQVRGHCL